ncbi:penicillin-binding protein 1A [soil metagenome]
MAVFRKNLDDLIEANPGLFDEDPRPRKKVSPAAPKPVAAVTASSPWQVTALRGLAHLGIALLMLPLIAGGAAVGGLAGWLESAAPIKEFDNYDPPETTTILDDAGRPLTALFEQRRAVMPLSEMSPMLPRAFVAIEDERFYDHMGIDPMGVARAFVTNLSRGKFSQGASTITQQTARNLLPRIGTDKTATRKITEALTALQMERDYTKNQILEVYLNQIYLGSGTYGVQAASTSYFGRPASKLEIWQCATLAGLPQLPERYSPLNNAKLAQNRRNAVLGRMHEAGFIDEAQMDLAVITDVTTDSMRVASGKAPYFVDAVRRMLANHPQLGGDELQTAGWRISTTVDPATQAIAEQTLADGLATEEQFWLDGRQDRFEQLKQEPEFAAGPRAGQVRMGTVVRVFEKSLVVELPGGWRADLPIPAATASYFRKGENVDVDSGVDVEVVSVDLERGLYKGRLLPQQKLQGALVCLDAKTGDVRALVGGRAYNDPANNGFFNRAVLARRQAGSTFKPLFFAAALEEGMTPTTVISDTPIYFPDGYSPHNYDHQFKGMVTAQTALEHSRNVPTIRIVQRVGLRKAEDFVRRFQRTGDKPWDMPLEWPVVLGTTSVTPLELAAAYQCIANGGVASGPRLIESICNEHDRDAINVPVKESERLIEPDACAALLQMMAGVMVEGTGRDLRATMPETLRDRVAGKSGTTNDNRDGWFAGFTPHEVAVVWVGFDQNIPLAPTRTGSKSAGPIWADFLSKTWVLKTDFEQHAPFRGIGEAPQPSVADAPESAEEAEDAVASISVSDR